MIRVNLLAKSPGAGRKQRLALKARGVGALGALMLPRSFSTVISAVSACFRIVATTPTLAAPPAFSCAARLVGASHAAVAASPLDARKCRRENVSCGTTMQFS